MRQAEACYAVLEKATVEKFVHRTGRMLAAWLLPLLRLGGLTAPTNAAKTTRVPATVLEEVARLQRTGRRVRLTAKRMPGLPNTGQQKFRLDGDDSIVTG